MAGRSSSRRTRLQLQFTESFCAVMTASGMPRMPSRVFAFLLAADQGEADAAQLAESLQASPAAISGAVRYLEQVKMVGRHRKPGHRKDTYCLAKGGWAEDIMGGRDQEIAGWEAASRDGADLLGRDTPAGARLDETARFFGFLRSELDGVMERWRAQQRR